MRIPELGKQIPLDLIVNQILKVFEFDRSGTLILSNGSLKAKGFFKPYGYLTVESPILNEKARLRIIHRDDFLLADSVFSDAKLLEYFQSNELLVCYSPKVLIKGGYSGSPHHVLHFLLAPKGTIESYYSNDANRINPNPERIIGTFIYGPNEIIRVNTLNPS